MDWYAQQQQQQLFLDDDEDADARQDEFEFSSKKEFVVFLIDAGSDMFVPISEEGSGGTYFDAVVKGVSNHLKTRIISQASDEVGVCFFNTREKTNLQECEGVYEFRQLGIPSAELIRDTDRIREKFDKEIGSKVVRTTDSTESLLFNALWVATGMLRTGLSKNVVKRIYIFTNNDDPLEGASRTHMDKLREMTLQKAKDAQDLGIGIELFPFNRPGELFNVKILYSDLVQLDDDDSNKFISTSQQRFKDLVDRLTKKMFKKRVVRKMSLTITNGLGIGLRTYAMMRPSTTGSTIWLDSNTNTPLKMDRTYVSSDTGSYLTGPIKRSLDYCGKKVLFNPDELQQVKKVTNVQLQLLGFKPLECLKDYHNLRPPTFLYPDEDAITGSTCAFIAFHRSMLRLQKFAVAFHGGSANPTLVALVAQEEQIDEFGQQNQPPGLNMIYLPYSDDIRPAEKYHSDAANPPARGSDQQIEKAINLMKKLELFEFSVDAIPNPALQRHYAVLQGLVLDEELPEMTDYTLPHEGMNRPSAVAAVKEFKNCVYGENYDEEMRQEAEEKAKGSATAQKRKAAAEVASKEANEYNWNDLADTGKLKDLTVVELKFYLTAHKLPLSGKKDMLISRILTHLGK
ncbi:unnamed protein product [Calypogeia fissa]